MKKTLLVLTLCQKKYPRLYNQLELGQVICMDFANYITNQVDGWPPFRPISLALKNPTYNIKKFLVPILNP